MHLYIQQFSKASGLFLNLSKCELMSIKECNLSEICNIQIKDQVSYLGVIITKNELERCSLNFNPLIESTQKNLSLKGRILLAKAEGLSRLTYAALSLNVDTAILKQIDTMLLNLVWKNKTHFIRKSEHH